MDCNPPMDKGQALLSMGFSRQEYWSGLPFPIPGDLPNSGIELMSLKSPSLTCGSLPLAPLGKTPVLFHFFSQIAPVLTIRNSFHLLLCPSGLLLYLCFDCSLPYFLALYNDPGARRQKRPTLHNFSNWLQASMTVDHGFSVAKFQKLT